MSKTHIPFWRVPKRVAYVVSHSYPHSTNGYAVRTHGIARALVEGGHSVIVITRPGRPWDLSVDTEIDVPPLLEIEGVCYRYIESPSNRSHGPEIWRELAAKAIEEELALFKPSVVLAASNWETALPAMEAARNLNLPFYYEVRGFWEITRASKETGWEKSSAFYESVANESRIAQSAERVFTLNKSMRDELIARGVKAKRISVVPNAWSAPVEQSVNKPIKNAVLRNSTRYVAGYIGSFVSYEGLDDLVAACATLRNSGLDLSLSLVGSSNPTSIDTFPGQHCRITQELTQLAKGLGFLPYLQIHGRVAPNALADYYDNIDLIVIPRKSLPVTNLVSPIKPLEAAAYGKAMLVSNVGGLSDVVEELGIPVFSAGDREDLARQMQTILRDEAKRVSLGTAAKQWIEKGRNFSMVVAPMIESFKIVEKVNRKFQPEQVVNQPSIAKESEQVDHRIIEISKQGGSEALSYYLNSQPAKKRPNKKKAFSYLRTAQHLLSNGETASAVLLADASLIIDNSLSAMRIALRVYLDATVLDKADTLAIQFRAKLKNMSASEEKLLKEITGRVQLAAWAAEPSVPRKLPVNNGRVLNFLAFSLPYTSVGYATRSHGLALGIKNAGWDIRPYTRPGFPFDLKPELEGQTLPNQDKIDGIVYRRIFDIGRKGMSEVEYMLSAVRLVEEIIKEEQPEIVHAASNYITALPALIAARRLGVPFIYEVRGFWEITRSSRDDGFENTTKYRFMQFYEGITARHADRVVTITTAMKEELIARGVLEKCIDIAYNSVDPDRFFPRPPNKTLAASLGIPEGVPVIGYVGSFVDYEGLDDLVTACAGLKTTGHDFRLLLVGDGAVLDDLKRQVEDTGLADKTIMTGRVPHEVVEDYYTLIDITPFPRKPWEVCELVSPLKPYEAMALSKAVVVSNTRALSEIVTHGTNGLHFEKGNVADLQQTLARLVRDHTLRKTLGTMAREWVLEQRTWDTAGKVCAKSYSMTQQNRRARQLSMMLSASN